MDIFPMGSDAPLSVDLMDDEIESLRTFDPESQRTIEWIGSRLLPAKNFRWIRQPSPDFATTGTTPSMSTCVAAASIRT